MSFLNNFLLTTFRLLGCAEIPAGQSSINRSTSQAAIFDASTKPLHTLGLELLLLYEKGKHYSSFFIYQGILVGVGRALYPLEDVANSMASALAYFSATLPAKIE
jgi:hypothetical protein